MSSVESTPGVFPNVHRLSNFGMAGRYVKAELAFRRYRLLVQICELGCKLRRVGRLFKHSGEKVSIRGICKQSQNTGGEGSDQHNVPTRTSYVPARQCFEIL